MEFTPDERRKAHKQMQEALKNSKNIRQAGRDNFSFERSQRQSAGKGDAKRNEPIFLRPQDIQKGLEYDIEKVFLTTLGGELRRLVVEDLEAFKKNIDLLRDQYSKGITAKQVINLSTPIDIKRCNEQIKMSLPLSIKEGVINFMTDASKESSAKHHYVNVELVAYKSMSLNPVALTIQNVKSKVNLGKLKFECDCGRHTYYYRYMASVGGYGYGRVEEGYPKERNPELWGLACKHVLRVMQYIMSPMGVQYVYNNLKKEKNTQYGKRRNSSDKQLNKALDDQLKIIESNTQKNIVKNTKKFESELNRRAKKLAENLQREQRKALAKEMRISEADAAKSIKDKALENLNELLKSGLITQEMYNNIKRGIR